MGPNQLALELEQHLIMERLKLQDDLQIKKIDEELNCLVFKSETVSRIQSVFIDEIEKGLKGESSSLQMENSYVAELPDGSENGKYLGLDLGGTNFRILLIEFNNGQIKQELVKYYHVDDELRLGEGQKLFDFLAECISVFVHEQDLQDTSIPLGFTFSFPMAQHSLQIGVLVSWTKSFNCPNVVERDVVQLLNNALEKRGDTKVRVDAVLNDTTGTLVMGALLDKRTAIGLILGTGSNACYFEKIQNVQHWETERHGEKEVILDIEWGAFGDNGVLDFIKTDFDKEVDKNSLLVNSFTFEKYISGKYLGEIVRVVLVHLTGKGLIFNGKLFPALTKSNTFTTTFVSQIEQDRVDGTSKNTEIILDNLNIEYNAEDIIILKHVCITVTNRAALLVAICLSTLLDRMDKTEVTIAVDGSLCAKHPTLKKSIVKYISLLTDKKFEILQVSDGSGKGACIVAAIAEKLEQRYNTTIL